MGKNKTNKTILNTITGFVASASAKDSTNIASKTYDHLINSRKKWDKSDRNHLIRSTVGIISDEFIENIGIDASNHRELKS